MILYHASKEIVQFPEIRKARYTKDFSWGFYCTNNLRQAIRWANRGPGEPIINYYNYEPNENLNILKFPDLSDGWLQKAKLYYGNYCCKTDFDLIRKIKAIVSN